MSQTKYVCGFLISYNFDLILLIDKGKKPNCELAENLQWSGIGGKIRVEQPIPEHPDLIQEAAHSAMEREFQEETAYRIKRDRWHCFLIKEYKPTKIYFFVSFASPDEITKITKAFKDGYGPEGQLATHGLVDILFDPAFYTFDIPYLINMVMRESRRGFLPKLDPEGINSANKKNS